MTGSAVGAGDSTIPVYGHLYRNIPASACGAGDWRVNRSDGFVDFQLRRTLTGGGREYGAEDGEGNRAK